MGPPGAGKGSQSARIRENYNIVSISTGQMFRDAYNNNEPIGIEAMEFIKNKIQFTTSNDEFLISMNG